MCVSFCVCVCVSVCVSFCVCMCVCVSVSHIPTHTQPVWLQADLQAWNTPPSYKQPPPHDVSWSDSPVYKYSSARRWFCSVSTPPGGAQRSVAITIECVNQWLSRRSVWMQELVWLSTDLQSAIGYSGEITTNTPHTGSVFLKPPLKQTHAHEDQRRRVPVFSPLRWSQVSLELLVVRGTRIKRLGTETSFRWIHPSWSQHGRLHHGETSEEGTGLWSLYWSGLYWSLYWSLVSTGLFLIITPTFAAFPFRMSEFIILMFWVLLVLSRAATNDYFDNRLII